MFVEVKARSEDKFGDPLEFIDKGKRKRIVECARYFLSIHEMWDMSIRFDVVGITDNRINWIENAFMEAE